MKYFILVIACLLSSCAAISEQASEVLTAHLQSISRNSGYPSAPTTQPELASSPPNVDLSYYKPINTRPFQNPKIAIAVAASGGGYRAANLTAGVLMGLEQVTDPHLQGNLLQEVDYFSTVSGGGFGVGYYIASLEDFMETHDVNGPFAPQFSFTNTMNNLPDINPLDKDYSGQLFFGADRGQLIEESWANSILKTAHGTLTLGDIFIPQNSTQQPQLPYWVTNSTIYQNAALLPFTPDVLAKYGVNTYSYDNKTNIITDYNKIPVAVGMAASASFPFALTPTTLGSSNCVGSKECYLHLIDGGLSDNLGVYTALGLLRQDPAKTKVLIVIDAYAGHTQPFSQDEYPPYGTTLFWRIMGLETDAFRQMIKPNIKNLARAELCHGKTSNVLVIYLDLSSYARAKAISTGLYLTPAQQKLLLGVGQSLVQNNPQFNQLLKPLLDGNIHIGQCSMHR
ncbi:MAG TPA: patatin-like phospholipase family protein [Gammaproteobacteria bacterium]|nr:patatin-like phospholipase family protein [Gammaproteobacteria bacterium]